MSEPSEPVEPPKARKHGLPPDAEPPPLPRWFALRGPEPGWLASHWSLGLATISGVALVLNGLLSQKLLPGNLYNEVTTAVAWLSTAALFLQSRQERVLKVAKWRAQVRAEEAAKGEKDSPD